MTKSDDVAAQEPPLESNGRAETRFRLPRGFVVSTIVFVLCFSLPLYDWTRFALQTDLYSYLLLVPFISAYLVWSRRNNLPPSSPPNRTLALAFVIAGAVVLGGYWSLVLHGAKLERADSLALTILSLVLFFAGSCAFFFGRSIIRAAAFPLVFLVFMIPFPTAVEHAVETFLQHGSAPPAFWFFQLAQTPVFRHDMIFQLPGGVIFQIAPECSGIRSTLVLFMTSLIAGHLFLRSPWKRTVIAVAVVPLALLRNGLRVFTIGELCVHVGPHMIDSNIHHKGGSIFFALSLIPFFLLLSYLVRLERRVNRAPVEFAVR